MSHAFTPLRISFDVPPRSDLLAMCLVDDGRSQTMLSKHGTRSRPDEHHHDAGGITLELPGTITVGPDVEVGTVIAPLLYRPPQARSDLRRSSPSVTIGSLPVHQCDASSAMIFTWAPALVVITPDGPQTEWIDLYSQPGSERRPKLIGGMLRMDAGLLNRYH